MHCDGCVPEFNIRTDLALEAREIVRDRTAAEIPGVHVHTAREDGIAVNRVTVESAEAARRLGKQRGRYITLEAPGLREKNTDLQDRLSEVISREILNLVKLPSNLGEAVLVVGLGNWNVTPDALGPRVVEDLLVTRHVMNMQENPLGQGFRSVCALSPGVMGLTGIETSEIVQALSALVKPSLVIAIDALAAHRLERLHTTVQLADAGVTPGSGVGNHRRGITRETIGAPVLAIGVPTVVEASTIAGEAMDSLVEAFKKETVGTGVLAEALKKIDWRQRQQLSGEVLPPYAGRLIVTPKEIDTFIEDIALCVAAGLNAALHPRVHSDQAGKYLQ